MSIAIGSWMVYFLVASLPGLKLYNGMILGCAESLACPFLELLLGHISDKNAAFFMCALCATANVVYRLMGAGEGGLSAMVVLWFAILAIGALVNALYIIVELRVPPE